MSTLPMDKLPQGAPYAIGAAVVQTLRTAPELVGAVVLDNPRRASDLSEGERIVFLKTSPTASATTRRKCSTAPTALLWEL